MEFFEKVLEWCADNGIIFGGLFIVVSGALLKMTELFGYPLDGPHKVVLFCLLIFVCVYGHYSLKAIRLWAYLRSPMSYSKEVFDAVREARSLTPLSRYSTSLADLESIINSLRALLAKIPSENGNRSALVKIITSLSKEIDTRSHDPNHRDLSIIKAQKKFLAETEWSLRDKK